MCLASLRRFAALFFFLASATLFAQEPWDLPAFSSDPKELVAAAEKVDAGEKGLVILLDEATYHYDAEGRVTSTWRLVFRIVSESSVAPNDSVSAEWAPWYHERPSIAARVVTKSGTVHMLDTAAITEAPDEEQSSNIFSDNRVLRAPLPAVEVGAVVEQVITKVSRTPIPGAGVSSLFVFGRWVPVQHSRLVISGPASLDPRIVNKTGIQPVVEEKDGIRRTLFETGRLEPFEDDREDYLPFDDAAYPYVAFSTGTSWQHIAKQYSEIVDKQIAGSDLTKLVANAAGKTTGRREIIARLLAAVQKDVRYAGVEIAEGSIIPRPPSTVLKNKYGDCKDKATLLVAMLRAAGFSAHVALVRSGTDLDVHTDLPGLGRFNHAIVIVDGDEPLWIDPTDEFARAGELPAEDQGRMALIASPETQSLTRTPESDSSAIRYTETRLFTLPEDGKAHVLEITETAGAEDATQRRWRATTNTKKFRESIESYVKSYYFAKALDKFETSDPHDLAKPFRLTIEANESGSGIVRDGEASVAIHPGALFEGLPSDLRNWREPQPDDDPKDLPKKRVHDFVFPSPRQKEWTYRIVPPAGYTPRQLPKNETRKLGTVTYSSEFATEPDGAVTAKLRIDSGKRRLTAAEYEQTRVAISKLLEEPQLNIGFDLIGQAKLNDGDVGGALGEFRKLVTLHPKEAQHHIEIARALLAGGLGEAAREEVRRAIAIEPKNARAYTMLAEVLQHDLLGRKYRKGSDIPGAITALRKAKELDPENHTTGVYLARLLAYADDGTQFGRTARLAESVEEYRALPKTLGDDAHEYDGELMFVLAHMGRFAELKELADNATKPATRDIGRILAIIGLEGIPAAQRELSAFAVDTRRPYAAELGKHLMSLRKYPEAAAMMEIASQGAPNASEAGQLIDVLKKARRLEDVKVADDDPRGIVTRLFAAVGSGDEEALLACLPPDLREDARKDAEKAEGSFLAGMRSNGAEPDMPIAAALDIVLPMMQLQKDGNDETGYRLRIRMPMVSSDTESFYVTREDGHYFLRASSDDNSLGLAALHFLDQNQPEAARTWLNWAREDVDAGGGDDPLRGSSFASIWPKAKATATADEIRLAAAVQMAERGEGDEDDLEKEKKATDLLEELYGKAASDAAKAAIDRAMTFAYARQHEWAKAAAPAQRLFERYPESDSAFLAYSRVLSLNGKTTEVETLAKQRLERLPKDRAALRALAVNASVKHDYAEAERYAQQVIDETSPDRADFNTAAWYGVFTGNLERAMENARQATGGSEKKDRRSAPSFHTLAVIFAENGKTVEARQALFSSMEQRNHDQPDSDDWYVLGRIAETYGVRDAALAAYKRVKDDKTGASVAELVERRMKGLK